MLATLSLIGLLSGGGLAWAVMQAEAERIPGIIEAFGR